MMVLFNGLLLWLKRRLQIMSEEEEEEALLVFNGCRCLRGGWGECKVDDLDSVA